MFPCRAGPDGLYAFMGCGDVEGGEAWTFICPPGHRIVGYSAAIVGEETDTDDDEDDSNELGLVYVARVRFVTASFEEPSS
jgi:hypothetical protein